MTAQKNKDQILSKNSNYKKKAVFYRRVVASPRNSYLLKVSNKNRNPRTIKGRDVRKENKYRHLKKLKSYSAYPQRKSHSQKRRYNKKYRAANNLSIHNRGIRKIYTRPGYFWVQAQPFIRENRRIRREQRRKEKEIKNKEVENNDKIVKLSDNVSFFLKTEGVYSSYWVGRLIGMLIRSGKKKIASKAVYTSFSILKYKHKQNPLLMLIEIIDKIKPAFKLRQYRFRRGRKFLMKEYPSIVVREKRYRIALRWLQKAILKEGSAVGLKFPEKIVYKLNDCKVNPRKNSLVKERKAYMKRIMWGQFNMRFNWKKKNKK